MSRPKPRQATFSAAPVATATTKHRKQKVSTAYGLSRLEIVSFLRSELLGKSRCFKPEIMVIISHHFGEDNVPITMREDQLLHQLYMLCCRCKPKTYLLQMPSINVEPPRFRLDNPKLLLVFPCGSFRSEELY